MAAILRAGSDVSPCRYPGLMNERQRIALASPCALAEDTLDPSFARWVVVGKFTMSTLLSVNK